MLTDSKVCFLFSRIFFAMLLPLFWTGCETHLPKEEKRAETPRFLRYTVKSYQQTMQILDNLGYTREAFKKGMEQVPDIELTRISDRWSDEAKNIPVEVKKSIFLRLLASGALKADREVARERKRLLEILRKIPQGPVSRKESRWLRRLAYKYKVIKKENGILTPPLLEELKKRVDIVPASLILAQGAVESGWGTSRFAVKGNALFGQWSFSKSSMKPREQRSYLGDYGLASFNTPLDSVRAYILNLNTHPAYREFREMRAKLRREGKPLSGTLLARTLENYSERGEAYIKELLKVIRVNNLSWLDHAKLSENSPVIIHPDA
ncbi:glucosaminidase domain-containing protein [Hydrogenimonas urashimensis]|uniref:glucosaminidase domain-containing protein n=1 Tax=Hydrogenimonas urashimensis TaxID=2740515 RepID=UPI0019169C19|nr:glucosaminidase domain-containing protein [Hydrogenimonas urashimensis]